MFPCKRALKCPSEPPCEVDKHSVALAPFTAIKSWEECLLIIVLVCHAGTCNEWPFNPKSVIKGKWVEPSCCSIFSGILNSFQQGSSTACLYKMWFFLGKNGVWELFQCSLILYVCIHTCTLKPAHHTTPTGGSVLVLSTWPTQNIMRSCVI